MVVILEAGVKIFYNKFLDLQQIQESEFAFVFPIYHGWERGVLPGLQHAHVIWDSALNIFPMKSAVGSETIMNTIYTSPSIANDGSSKVHDLRQDYDLTLVDLCYGSILRIFRTGYSRINLGDEWYWFCSSGFISTG